MTIEEVKSLITSAQSIEREISRMKREIEARRQELLSIKSSLGGSSPVVSSVKMSVPEKVYFGLEELYSQYNILLQCQYDKREEIERAISTLDPLEQEIARSWIAGKTEEQIGRDVGYSRSSVQRAKRRILVRIAASVKDDAS